MPSMVATTWDTTSPPALGNASGGVDVVVGLTGRIGTLSHQTP